MSASRGAPAEARQRREIGERLGEVRLALPVAPHDGGRPRLEIELRRHVVAELDQLEPPDDHRDDATEAARTASLHPLSPGPERNPCSGSSWRRPDGGFRRPADVWREATERARSRQRTRGPACRHRTGPSEASPCQTAASGRFRRRPVRHHVTSTVSGRPDAPLASAQRRTLRRAPAANASALRDPDGHQQVEVVVAVDAADDGGLEAVDRRQRDLLRVERFDAGGEVVGVERDGELRADGRRVELLGRVADVLRDGSELQSVGS